MKDAHNSEVGNVCGWACRPAVDANSMGLTPISWRRSVGAAQVAIQHGVDRVWLPDAPLWAA